MPVRAVWRPPWYAWLLLGAVALILGDRIGPGGLRGDWLVLIPLAAVGTLLVRTLWSLHPSVTMCASIALTIFSGAWSQMGLGGLPLDRLLLVIVLLQFVLRAPGAAHTPRMHVQKIHLLMGVAILYVAVSAVASHTLTTETGFLSFFDQFGLAPYLVFLAAPAVFAGEHERRLLLATLVGLGAYLGFTAIFESIGPHALVFPRYILRVDAELPGHRAGGPFQSSVSEGIATFACAVAAVIALTRWRGLGTRALAAIAGLVSLFGCFLTLERGVWIAAAAGIVITASMTSTGRRLLLPGVTACVIVIGGALLLSPALAQKTSTRINDHESVWARENQTAAGLRMIQAKPLFGFGWDRYTTDGLAYFRESADYPFNGWPIIITETHSARLPLHNAYLSYAVELGIVGALLWFAVFLWGMGDAIFSRGSYAAYPWKLGLLAIAICFFVVGFFNPYQAPFPTMLIWVWAGVALTGQSAMEQSAMRERSAA
jgi:putative inorganic carbon (HCO3(-)) transporter